jgi:transposase
VILGIIYVLKHGLQWQDATRECAPHKTLHNRYRRWMERQDFSHLAVENCQLDTLMIDATHLKAYRTASRLIRGALPLDIGWTIGGLNTKLHLVCDGEGRPPSVCLTVGQTLDHVGAKLLYPALRDAAESIRLADKGYASDDFSTALRAKSIHVCPTAKRTHHTPQPIAAPHINSDLRSKTSWEGSKTGAGSPPAATAEPTS